MTRMRLLKTLKANDNRVAAVAWIGRLGSLEELHLHENDLRELAGGVGQLTRLAVLRIEFNALKSLPPSFARLTSLRSVTLQCNDLATVPPCLYASEFLQSLETLVFGNTIEVILHCCYCAAVRQIAHPETTTTLRMINWRPTSIHVACWNI
jgi:Leucine-rich repeat (LRR) protein